MCEKEIDLVERYQGPKGEIGRIWKMGSVNVVPIHRCAWLCDTKVCKMFGKVAS